MRIISTFLPPSVTDIRVGGRPAIVMAMDTLVEQKAIVVGVTIGRVNGQSLDDVVLSEVGRLVVERCRRHMELNYPDGAVVVAGVAKVAGAKERVRHVLAKAPEHAFVLLVAATDDVCAAVIQSVGLQHQAPGVEPQ